MPETCPKWWHSCFVFPSIFPKNYLFLFYWNLALEYLSLLKYPKQTCSPNLSFIRFSSPAAPSDYWFIEQCFIRPGECTPSCTQPDMRVCWVWVTLWYHLPPDSQLSCRQVLPKQRPAHGKDPFVHCQTAAERRLPPWADGGIQGK